jgi:photosystem II stability/assembly factor-like uncharacterized protein
MRPASIALAAALLIAVPATATAATADILNSSDDPALAPPAVTSGTFSDIRARLIGPAISAGRISDIAVNPDNHAEYYVGVASGGVWKTTDGGVTYDPIFDRQGSYSIGCITIDPTNHHVVWVGTGEKNAQRSVSVGDGVYRSDDGGRTWRHMGLKDAGQVGMILVHPEDPNVVYVAAQGPLWSPGGDRGLYRSMDAGETWERILHVDEHTGVNEVHFDPRDPGVMYASTWQRRRRVWTMINGGPGSGIWKSVDGGDTWTELTRGLPGGDKGKIGLDVSPANPDIVYAIVEAKDGQTGFFRTVNRGASWSRMSSYTSSAPMYYHEIMCHPYDADTVFMMDTFLNKTTDGGRTWTNVQGRGVHVDNHALWINPDDTNHMISGNDGGVYETRNGGGTYRFHANLPITQFYRVAVDNAEPFYNVYGGTQDNNTLGGPSRTINREGIMNEDWFVTVGGDGFEPQVDPTNPDIVYCQWQYGGLVRFDKRTGETTDIKPQPAPGDAPFVFNWDAPLLISPHDHERIYFAGRRLHRSDNRGDDWTQVSGDLSRGIDRNELEVMGRVWPVDAVAKHRSTSIYGNIVSLDESPMVEGLIYVGTDDGLIQVTEDGGETWRRIDAFPGVPHMTYVSALRASRHDADTVYAGFDGHKNGDFRPHLLVSRDRGMSWTSIAGDLPDRDVVYTITEDHVRPSLLFVGTEYGAYYTLHGHAKSVPWTKIGGLPTIAVQDIEIQRRENDLVLATFGRGIYIVDDYSPLQTVTKADMEQDVHVFPVKDALFYIPTSKGRGSQGASFYRAQNPDFGAVITWHMKDSVRTGPRMDGSATKPEYDKLREQERTRSAAVWMTIRDADGNVITRMRGSTGSGVHRDTWNLRYADGPYVLPGTYYLTISKQVDGEITELTEEPAEIVVRHLEAGVLQPEDRVAVRDFHREVVALSQAAGDAGRAMRDLGEQLGAVERAVFETLEADQAIAHRAHELQVRLTDLEERLNGDRLPARFEEPTLPGIRDRIGNASSTWRMTAPPTGTQRAAFEYAAADFGELMADLRVLLEEDWPQLKDDLDAAGVQWTPGRMLRWGE